MSLHITKLTNWSVHPVTTHISLGICPVWSVFFAVCMKKAWVLSYPLSAQRRLWSDWGMPRLIWIFAGCTSFHWFCYAAAHMYKIFISLRLTIFKQFFRYLLREKIDGGCSVGTMDTPLHLALHRALRYEDSGRHEESTQCELNFSCCIIIMMIISPYIKLMIDV